MAISSYILEQALRQLRLPESALRQFSIAQELSNVDGRGFPRELFQLSVPVIVRGLLNFAVFQMRRDWIYPAWVHRQLDPDDVSFVARAQNPIFVNSTNRNWTMLGSPHGKHEAIVDRYGLATPLPREWSLDIWLLTDEGFYVPSRSSAPRQEYDTTAPVLRTLHSAYGLSLTQEHFVGTTNNRVDVLFQKIVVRNNNVDRRRVTLAVSVRPFNPEGVAPIDQIASDGDRFVVVNGVLGLVLAEVPNSILFSSGDRGDLAELLRHGHGPQAPLRSDPIHLSSASCEVGLAHGSALYDLELEPGAERAFHASVALGTERVLRSVSARRTWRVSYDRRLQRHREVWSGEQAAGAQFTLPDHSVQKLLEANRLALLQLHDKDMITPGPFLYHHMRYRDAATMCRALDVLGFHGRTRAVMNGFRRGQTRDGFYRGPDGEWDSNGAVLWIVRRHYEMTRSQLWLRAMYPSLRRAGSWIMQQRRRSRRTNNTHAGLMPMSLSAEHLGTVDQYYWDTLYSVAGLRALALIAADCRNPEEAADWQCEAEALGSDIHSSLTEVERRLGMAAVPATPSRGFDESAIGSVAGIYPLAVHDIAEPAFRATVTKLRQQFVREGGFLHPFIHSGYNPYLTMQLAHAELWLGNVDGAWEVARTILRQSGPPYSLPEAIHPRTGGGSMGDGHHGWAAAEIILFIRDCLVDDRGNDLRLLEGAGPMFEGHAPVASLAGVSSKFGPFDLKLTVEQNDAVHLEFHPKFFTNLAPAKIEVRIPFPVRRVLPSSPSHVHGFVSDGQGTRIQFSPDVRSVLLVR